VDEDAGLIFQLFLQIIIYLHLKEDCGLSWKVIEDLALKITPCATFHCVHKIIERKYKEFQTLLTSTTEARLVFYETEVDLNFCGSYLAEVGVGHRELSDIVNIQDKSTNPVLRSGCKLF
jgi:hypothetical protein